MKNIKIIKADNMGFCFGVNRAVKLTEEALSRCNKVYMLGPLIHNPQEVNRLIKKGVTIIDEISEDLKGSSLIIRSHGIAPDEYKKALELDMEIIDATCPYVRKAQNTAKKLSEEGYEVIISGEANHPEITGILGYAPGAIVISSKDEIGRIDFKKPTGILSQTTQNISLLKEIVSNVLPETFELRVFNTICNATEERQKSACKLSSEADLIIVIGGKESANTTRLAAICSDGAAKVYHIETSEELNSEWFHDEMTIGITAGASTPEWLVEEIIGKINEICQK
jgi:4-hydroxy-3-methylbut-2-enyl diphosphate reductase